MKMNIGIWLELAKAAREILKFVVPGGGRYKRFFYKANLAFVIINLQGYILETNTEFCKRLGCDPGEMLGKRLLSFISDDVAHVMLDTLEVLREGGAIRQFTTAIITKSGGIADVEMWAVGNGEIYIHVHFTTKSQA